MAYGKIKADTLVYDNSGSDAEVTLASIGNKAGLASPAFTGTPTAPTAAADTNTTQIATTAYVQTELGDYATKAGPTFTGTVTIPTPASGDNSTKAASTAFVVDGFAPKAAPAFTGTATGVNLTLSGNLTVNGTTTTINSTTLTVDDKNIELGTVDTPTDTTADGGGITLKGATDKEIKWINATDSWTFNQAIEVKGASGAGGVIQLTADAGEDNNDKWRILASDGGDFYLQNYVSGGWSDTMLKAVADGTVELYHNNSKKIETTAAGVTVTGTVSDSKGNVRKIPLQDESSGAYVLVATDAGQAVHCHSSTTQVTVNQSVFATGDAVTIVNGGSSDLTITQGSSFTLRNSADASTGNRTLSQFGMATLWFSGHNVAFISGAGLS